MTKCNIDINFNKRSNWIFIADERVPWNKIRLEEIGLTGSVFATKGSFNKRSTFFYWIFYWIFNSSKVIADERVPWNKIRLEEIGLMGSVFATRGFSTNMNWVIVWILGISNVILISFSKRSTFYYWVFNSSKVIADERVPWNKIRLEEIGLMGSVLAIRGFSTNMNWVIVWILGISNVLIS